jgi:hypothetical protein
MNIHEFRPALHPPYSQDIVPYDFALFNHVKMALQRLVFKSVKKFFDGVTSIVATIQLDTLLAIFHEWMDRFQACIDDGGDYSELTLLWSEKLMLI